MLPPRYCCPSVPKPRWRWRAATPFCCGVISIRTAMLAPGKGKQAHRRICWTGEGSGREGAGARTQAAWQQAFEFVTDARYFFARRGFTVHGGQHGHDGTPHIPQALNVLGITDAAE